jgi:hypothetical protein
MNRSQLDPAKSGLILVLLGELERQDRIVSPLVLSKCAGMFLLRQTIDIGDNNRTPVD